MAYKFQLGAAILSGSLTQEGQVLAKDSAISGSSLSIAGTAVSSTAAELNLVDGSSAGSVVNNKAVVYGAAGQVNATSVSSSAAISGGSISLDDATGLAETGGGIANTDGKLELEMVSAGATVAVADDTFYFADSDNGDNIRSGSFVDLAGAFAGDGLSAASGVMAVSVDDSSIETNSDSIRVKALGITNAMLAGSIANAKLSNSTISGIALGSNLNSLSAGNGISMTSFNGSAAVSDLTIQRSGSTHGLNLDSGGLAVKLSGSGGLGVDAGGVFIALPSGAGLELAADGLKIEDGGVDNDMLAGSIANTKLVNDSVTVGTTEIDLGASSTTLAGMTGIDFAASDASIAASIGANTLTLGGASTTIRVAGDLDVVGTLNRVTETELLIEDKVVIVASGSSTAILAANSGIKVDIATGDMAFLYRNNGFGDAASSGDIWVASGSAGLIDIQAENFYGDGSNLTGVSADSILYSVASKADGNTLESNKVNFFADLSSNATVTMPAVTNDDIGTQLFIKAKNLTNNATIIINTANAAQKIDAQDSIVLESPFAAVTLIYVATDDWRVF